MKIRKLFFAVVLSVVSLSHTRIYADQAACAQLTPSAFTDLIATLENSLSRATIDCNLFCQNGTYNVAAQYNQEYLTTVLAKVNELQTWLDTNGLSTPYITNATAAYSVYLLAADTINPLHHARHWATISANYHFTTATDRSGWARMSIEFTNHAIDQLEALSKNGNRCFVDMAAPFAPYPN